MKITGNALINDTLKAHPEIAEILMAYGLNCVNCHFSSEDTIESGAKIHGLTEEDVEMIVRDINEILRGSE